MAGPQQTIFAGDVFDTNDGPITVIKYESCNNITVQFSDGNSKATTSAQIRNGLIKNPYRPIICDIGYVGSLSKQYNANAYNSWVCMLRRCYDNDFQTKHPAYRGCSVDISWHNFENFESWYSEQPTSTEQLYLDKDLRSKGNKIYCEDTCSLVPREINNLLENRKASRGKYPVGVHWNKKTCKFVAQFRRGGIPEYIGQYYTAEEAFLAYKIKRETYVKQTAEKYKGILHKEVYSNLVSFTVDIND